MRYTSEFGDFVLPKDCGPNVVYCYLLIQNQLLDIVLTLSARNLLASSFVIASIATTLNDYRQGVLNRKSTYRALRLELLEKIGNEVRVAKESLRSTASS